MSSFRDFNLWVAVNVKPSAEAKHSQDYSEPTDPTVYFDAAGGQKVK